MHELSICQSLLQQLETLCRQRGAIGVGRVTLQVGTLAGVEPQLLAEAFRIAREGSCARRAELCIETLPPYIRCRACGVSASASPQRLSCAACGASDTLLLGGDELLLREVQLTIPPEEHAHVQ